MKGRWPPANRSEEHVTQMGQPTWRPGFGLWKETVSMSFVLVIDQEKQPCQPVHPGQARRLLRAGKAVVYRRFPFIIRLKAVRDRQAEPVLRLKLDPGATTTGIAIIDDTRGQVVWAAELAHRGQEVKEHLAKRRAIRRSRRQRHTRYRPARFANRRRRPGWPHL